VVVVVGVVVVNGLHVIWEVCGHCEALRGILWPNFEQKLVQF
jgi:hypothetical protein